MTRSLIGRDDELARVDELFDQAEHGHAALVLTGDPGIGKTSLWVAGLTRAETRGYRVLLSRASEAETRLSYTAVADLLEGVVDEVLPALPPIQRRALERALLLGETEGEADGRAVAAAFFAALRILGADRALCLALDDVQWLDAASLDAIRFSLSRLEAERVASLFSVRGQVPSWLRRTLPDDRLTVLELDGLSIGALHELLRERLGTGLSRPTLVRLFETSAGNPFFALELALALERRGFATAPNDPLPIPSSLDELLRERLGELGSNALEAATVTAALSEPTIGLLRAALGDVADTGLLEALDAHVLEVDDDRLRFSHPLLGSAISARQTQAARRALHARLAEIVTSQEERARHLAVATIHPDDEVAATIEAAARAAHARGAPLAAAELADESVRLTPREELDDARRRLLFAADRYYAAANLGRAKTLLERARRDAAPGRESAVVLVQLARMVASPREATDLLFTALDEATDDDLVAEIHLDLAGLMRFREGVERGLEYAELAVAAARRVGEPVLRCRALAAYGLLRFNAGRGIPGAEMEEALTIERTLPDWPLNDGSAFISCHQLWWSGAVERARELLHEVHDALEARHDVPGQANALWYLALTEWRAGDWVEADRCATASLELAAQLGPVSANQAFAPTIVDAHLGRVDRVRRAARLAIERSREEGVLVGESGFNWVLGCLELSLGDPGKALPHLRRAHELRNETFVLEPGMRLEIGDLVESLVAADELEEADRALLSVERRARALDRAWALAVIARGRGLVLAARGDLSGAFASFDTALAEHGRVTDPYQHARTLLALGRTQRRAKKRGAARETLEDTLARFDALGAPLWAEQTRAELARIGGRAPSRGELTEAERRIALLVAEGRRNREVAAELYLTEHSVETALSRIYRKLGIHSRGELGRALSKS